MWKIQKRREGGWGRERAEKMATVLSVGNEGKDRFSLSLTHSCCCLCLYNFITLQCGSRRFLLSRFFFALVSCLFGCFGLG